MFASIQLYTMLIQYAEHRTATTETACFPMHYAVIILNHFVLIVSLSDAEVGEDVGEGLLGGDFAAGDGGEVVEAVAEIFGHEVGG